MAESRCVCGCGRTALPYRHHAIYQQHIPPSTRKDERNLVAVSFDCHGAHHLQSRKLRLAVLPDSVFEFGREVLGPGKAYNFLRRRYAGEDPRLDALLG